ALSAGLCWPGTDADKIRAKMLMLVHRSMGAQERSALAMKKVSRHVDPARRDALEKLRLDVAEARRKAESDLPAIAAGEEAANPDPEAFMTQIARDLEFIYGLRAEVRKQLQLLFEDRIAKANRAIRQSL